MLKKLQCWVKLSCYPITKYLLTSTQILPLLKSLYYLRFWYITLLIATMTRKCTTNWWLQCSSKLMKFLGKIVFVNSVKQSVPTSCFSKQSCSFFLSGVSCKSCLPLLVNILGRQLRKNPFTLFFSIFWLWLNRIIEKLLIYF